VVRECLAGIAQDARHLVVVSAADGMLLSIHGDARIRRSAAASMNFTEGALWDESSGRHQRDRDGAGGGPCVTDLRRRALQGDRPDLDVSPPRPPTPSRRTCAAGSTSNRITCARAIESESSPVVAAADDDDVL